MLSMMILTGPGKSSPAKSRVLTAICMNRSGFIPTDAAKRGIQDGDIVNVFNERGGVLAGARVWERIMPGVVYMDHGARHDPIIPGELDRGGAINTITPHNITSKNAMGMATSGFLVEVEKIDMDELRKKYPEAFNKPYDKAAGLCRERVMKR